MFPKHPAILAVVGLLSVLALWGCLQVKMDTSLDVWFLDDDEDLLSYHAFVELFHSDQVVVVTWEDEQLWTEAGIAFVRTVSEALGSVKNVQQVQSLTAVSEVVAAPGMLEVRPLWDKDAPPPLAELRDRVLTDRLLAGTLVSHDGRFPAVVLTVEPLVDDVLAKRDLAMALRAEADRLGAERGVELVLAGPTMLDEAFYRHTEEDMLRIFPAMVGVIVVAIFGLFRTLPAVFLPLTVVLLACLWVTGLMGLLDIRLTIVQASIYPMILGVGVASAIHVLTRALVYRRAGIGPDEAASSSLRHLLAPCFFTSLTTVGGLMSLQTASLAPVRQLGGLGATGVVFSFLLTFAIGPWILPRLSSPEGEAGAVEDATLARLWATMDRGLLFLAALAQRRAGLVVGCTAVATALFIAGIPQLRMGANPLNYFRPSDPVRQQLEFVDRHLSGSASAEVLVDTGKPDGLKDPAVLAAMLRVQDFLQGIDGVGATVSMADYVQELRRAMRGGDEKERRLPESRAEVAQLLLLLDDPEDLERLADFEFQRGRINATLAMSRSEALTEKLDAVESLVDEAFPVGVEASVTGLSKLIANMETYLLDSQIRSLSLAFVLVLGLMVVAMRSLRLGLFAMVPNLLPIVWVLGGMGWVGIALDPGTVMTGAVALGLVVDDTVHFLHFFRERILAGDSIEDATRRTLQETGRAIVMTSVILCAGFWLMCAASFQPNIYFGLLCGAAIALALGAVLVALPAALAVVRPRLRPRSSA